MEKIFGIPILIAIVLGILFPYVAFELVNTGLIFLFMLMFFAGLTIDWNKLSLKYLLSPTILVALFFLFVVFPVCQWLIAKLIISDSQYLFGLVLASLCPVAIVAPYFCKVVDSDAEVSFYLVVISMLIFPFVAPVMLGLLSDSSLVFESGPIVNYMVLLTTVPLFLGFIVYKYLRRLRDYLNERAGIINSICLSFLIFLLFGTAARRTNMSYTGWEEIAAILAIVFVQNFVVLIAARSTFLLVFPFRQAISMAISLSMKNYALAAGILLFYDPKASLAPALGFLAHAVLFNIIPLMKKSKFFSTNSNR